MKRNIQNIRLIYSQKLTKYFESVERRVKGSKEATHVGIVSLGTSVCAFVKIM